MAREKRSVKRGLPLFLALLSLLLGGPAAAHMEGRPPGLLGQVSIDQRLDGRLPLDLIFYAEDGRPVRLRDFFGRTPVILSLNYFACPRLCPLVLEGLLRGLKPLSLELGRDFAVVTVSIDPGETPAQAAAAKEKYLSAYGGAARDGWHFLIGDPEAIDKLARSVGFRYAYDAGFDQFAHAAAIVVATPDGRISRYLYGVEYAPRDLRLALVESSEGRIGGLVDRVLLYCYRYDPAAGKYSALILNSVRAGGALTVLALAAFLLTAWRRERRRRFG
jgi:protein SCO1/2